MSQLGQNSAGKEQTIKASQQKIIRGIWTQYHINNQNQPCL